MGTIILETNVRIHELTRIKCMTHDSSLYSSGHLSVQKPKEHLFIKSPTV